MMFIGLIESRIIFLGIQSYKVRATGCTPTGIKTISASLEAGSKRNGLFHHKGMHICCTASREANKKNELVLSVQGDDHDVGYIPECHFY